MFKSVGATTIIQIKTMEFLKSRQLDTEDLRILS